MSNDTAVAVFADALADRSTWRIGDNCPIARALEIIGTRSAILIIREAFYGTSRFDDFADRVEITQAVAATRLRELTEAGVLTRVPYKTPGQRTRYEYRLTKMGRDLAPAVIGIFQWGGKYLSPGGTAPLRLTHADCGRSVQAELRCRAGHAVQPGDIRVLSASRAKSRRR